LHVHPVTAVFHRVVWFVRRDAVGGDQSAVEDDEAFRRLAQGFAQGRGALGEKAGRLAHVPAGGGGGDAEPGGDLGQGLVLAQVHQDQQGLPEAAQPAPAGVQFTPSGVDEPGNVLNDLVRDVEYGSIRDQQGSCVETLTSEITSRNDQKPCRVTAPDRQPSSPASHRMRSVQ